MALLTVHTCVNCNLIDEAISEKSDWFEELNKENVKLHLKLVDLESANYDLSQEIHSLKRALVSEREFGFKLFMDSDVQKIRNRNNTRLNKSEHEDKTKVIEELMNYIKIQRDTYMENLEKCDEYKNEQLDVEKQYQYQLKEELQNLLSTYQKSTAELTKQKQLNVEEHERFAAQIEFLNKKYSNEYGQIQKTQRFAKDISKNTHNAINSLSQQLMLKEEQVYALKQTCKVLEQQIHSLEKEKSTMQQKCNETIVQYKTLYKKAQEKCAGIEKRRLLEGEGFRVDIKNLRGKAELLANQLAKITAKQRDISASYLAARRSSKIR